ncbi:hypothetical protein chiPu_0028808 [Chiloscyllium punctatum]|uniref:Uncharacterized protein n=1 Tax=Chiloscyllium punctatum TaxID=137246 RepID=A0A401TR13_CHIPU|nr:hypothetical protein [Chiloscyllium punctatum]
MSKSQVDGLVKTLEALTQELELTKCDCRQQLEAVRGESEQLKQRCQRLEQELDELKKSVAELLDTKLAFEARERQVRKLSKQL